MAKNRKNNQPANPHPNAQTVVTKQSVSYSEMHVGPLPPARDLVLLEEHIPGAFDRIMSLAEREQENQAGFTQKLVNANCFYAKFSLVLCFGVVIIYMVFLFTLAFLRMEEALKYAIVTGIVAGIPAVIYSLRGIMQKSQSNGQHQ